MSTCRKENSAASASVDGSRRTTSSFCRSVRSRETTAAGVCPARWARSRSQKMRPTTAASWLRRFSSGGRLSRRAARSAWIDLGISISLTGCPGVHCPSVTRTTPWSTNRRTSSSVKRGLPSETSTTRRRSSGGKDAPTSASSSCSLSPVASGSSTIDVAFGSPPPHAGRRSSSSCLARHRMRIGASDQRARYSMKSSRPSSAQWMSSRTSTSGARRAMSSRYVRQASNNWSRSTPPSAGRPITVRTARSSSIGASAARSASRAASRSPTISGGSSSRTAASTAITSARAE
jgi:hypothetical protein